MGGLSSDDYCSISIPIEKQCGILAVARLADVSLTTAIDCASNIEEVFVQHTRIAKTSETSWEEIVQSNGLHCYHLMYLMRKINNSYCDCRYCMKHRTIGIFPFASFQEGLVALKFRTPSFRTHWVAFRGGHIIDGDDVFTNTAMILKKYKDFDGFGHMPVFISQTDAAVLRDSLRNPCENYSEECDYCMRKSYCLERLVYRGDNRNFRGEPANVCRSIPDCNETIETEMKQYCTNFVYP